MAEIAVIKEVWEGAQKSFLNHIKISDLHRQVNDKA
jgi:hypothetical protein